jgi:uncharacterized protein YbjT (DUF2867 family)
MSGVTVTIIGATGMLGRPVARRLVEEGFRVRALVRDVQRARKALPGGGCELVPGDVRDEARLLEAVDGSDAVYINLAEPMVRKRPAWDPEVDGTRAVIAAAKAGGVRRVLRISAMGVEDAAIERKPWWAAVSKRDADHALMDSGLDWTIFRPTWFMESLCTMRLGRTRMMLCPDLPRSPLRWIAGEDYARQVCGALCERSAINRIYQPQGPELLTIKQAMRRFIAAWQKQRLRLLPTPLWTMQPAAGFAGKAHYLVSLMDMTRDHFSRIDRQAIATDLPTATMTIEDYARYVEKTGDWPRK